MYNKICFPIDQLLIMFCILIGITTWYIHYDKKLHLNEPNYKYNNSTLNNIMENIAIQNSTLQPNNDKMIQNRIELNERDRKVLYDDFAPPERRVPEYMYPSVIKNSINIPTRGIPENYQILGIVIRNNTETVFNLFGRQTFPGSNQYEYYVESTTIGNNYKIPIMIHGNKEIEDGQHITIPSMDHSKGHFKVNLYKLDAPRYNPFII